MFINISEQWLGRELTTISCLEEDMYALIDRMYKNSQDPLLRALFAAVEQNNVGSVEKLLREGVDLSNYVRGSTALGDNFLLSLILQKQSSMTQKCSRQLKKLTIFLNSMKA